MEWPTEKQTALTYPYSELLQVMHKIPYKDSLLKYNADNVPMRFMSADWKYVYVRKIVTQSVPTLFKTTAR